MKHSSSDILLGFDFGMKRIGVAVGQMVTKTARPLGIINAKEGKPQKNDLDKLIKTWRPNGIVVGIPLNMDGTEQFITHEARHFAEELHKEYSVPVYGVDERLTTKEAREQMFAKGGYKALQNGLVDSVAAQIILETWFMQLES